MNEAILNALSEPILVLDTSLHAMMANSAFFGCFGIAPRKLAGKTVDKLVPLANGQSSLERVLDGFVKNDTHVNDIEVHCVLTGRAHKVYSVNARRVLLTSESPEFILVEFRDVTYKKEADRKLQEHNDARQQHGMELEGINRELESFTHSVSHDLRTPLRLTNKIAHMLLHDHGPQLPTGAVEKVHMILDSTHQMGKLIEDLLSFSQVQREPMKKRRVDLRRLAREALEQVADEQRGREVETTIDELPAGLADRSLMKQVFINLLANALKFTRPCKNAKIHVGFTQVDGETVYFVRDNGIGFDMSQADAIFVVFHRLHKTHSFEGSGVGLALVKRIIDRHNGQVWAEGEPDNGATVYFTLGE